MPLYEYKCPNGHVFEVIHGMTQPSPTTCEVCGASPLVRVLHPVAVHYKGSGFYSTDYGRGGKKPVKDGGGSGESSSGSSGDSGSGSAGSGSSSGSGDSSSSSSSSSGSGDSGSSSGSKSADS
jgi:putative FmdB family regulatory protein